MQVRRHKTRKPAFQSSSNNMTLTGSEIGFIKGEVIDSGSIGVVYHAKLDMPETHEMFPILSRHKWVFKKVPKKYFIPSEPKIAARYANAYPDLKNHPFSMITANNKIGWMMEYIPGKPFSRDNTEELNFKQLMQLVFELVVRTNLFHHRTMRGNAVVHGDINRGNIHFNVYPDPSRLPDIDYLDYGLSFELIKDDPALVKKNHSVQPSMNLNKNYFAPEAWQKHLFGIKTDIYMLAVCIEEVLLGRLPSTRPDISFFIKGYLAKAKGQYQKRPDSDEFMKFFTLVNQFYNIPTSDSERKNRVAAKLAVLYAQKSQQKIIDNDEDITWQQYYLHDVGDFNDYDNDVNITVRCIAAHNAFVEWQHIIDHPDFVKSIARLDKNRMISKERIEFLFNHPDICKEFADGSVSVLPTFLDESETDMKKIAIIQIKYRLSHAESIVEVNDMIAELEDMAANNQINYLYARQGCSFGFCQNVSGRWIKIMKMAEQRKMELTYSQITFDDFKAAYNENYHAAFFKNPWSKMRSILDKYIYHTMDDVFKHARNNPDSRTARVLKALALNKIVTIAQVENTRHVI